MRKTLLVLIPWMACAGQSTPPPTKVDPVTETLYGVKITDPYRWLEDQNSPATREWLAAQDKYARSYLDAIAGRDTLRAKFEALLKIDSVGTPSVRHGRYFFSRRMAGEDRASLIVRRGYTGKDEVLVDPRTATDDATTSLDYVSVSNGGVLHRRGRRLPVPDHQLEGAEAAGHPHRPEEPRARALEGGSARIRARHRPGVRRRRAALRELPG
jgi:hypothetical protein